MSPLHVTRLLVPFLLTALVGCGGSPKPTDLQAEEAAPQPKAAPAAMVSAGPDSLPRAYATFEQAIRPADQPPAGATRPPDATFTGFPVFKLMRQVREDWPAIRFEDDEGRPVSWIVTMETQLGAIEISVLPHLAPNHARHFLALVKAGYYKGMRFDRIRQEELVDAGGQVTARVEQLEAGCPLGTGETAGGGLGYWLRHESHPDARHAIGMVGACRDEEADTACSRFFILLSDSPHLDGHQVIFAKVTKGLDVARAILKQSSDATGEGKPPVLIETASAKSTVAPTPRP